MEDHTQTGTRRAGTARARPGLGGRASSLRPLLFLLPLLCLLIPDASLAAQSEADTAGTAEAEADVSPEGLYTAEQAERGETVFRDRCSICHLSGQFRGSSFWFQWEGRPVLALVDQLRATMPQDNPGGLPTREYVDVVAYLFRLNRLPAGEEELPLEDPRLRVIRIPERENDG